MIDYEIKPYSGEDEVSFTKRRAYYYRIVMPRISYGEKSYNEKIKYRKLISPKDKKEIDAMWSCYLTEQQIAALVDYPFYEVYNTVLRDGERLAHYIPDTFYGAFIDDFYTNPQHSNPCDDKALYDLFFHDVNRPRTIFRKSRDMFLDENYHEISLEHALERISENNEVILKIGKFSYGGKGILFWKSSNQNKDELNDYLQNADNVVCQEVIKQHESLERLNSSSINTVRIMTLLINNRVNVLSSVLRMGVNGSRTDNASSGGIVCGIESDGQLKNYAFDTSAKKYNRHPQGADFGSVKVPNYYDCIDMAVDLAKRFSTISRLISWDIAIDADGQPLLIEANFSGGELDFHQLCNGPIFGNLTNDVLNEVFNNSFTLKSIIKSLG